jgi:hypothetical protein
MADNTIKLFWCNYVAISITSVKITRKYATSSVNYAIQGYTDKEALFHYLEGDVVDEVLLEYGREVNGVVGGVVAVAGMILLVVLVKML